MTFCNSSPIKNGLEELEKYFSWWVRPVAVAAEKPPNPAETVGTSQNVPKRLEQSCLAAGMSPSLTQEWCSLSLVYHIGVH